METERLRVDSLRLHEEERDSVADDNET